MILNNTDQAIDNLYYLLWLKDSGLKDSSFVVKIPDTIIIKSNQIMNWFFSSKNNDGILVKKDYNLNHKNIFETFTRKISKSGIVAYFIENIKTNSSENEIVIRYFTKEKFREFLFAEKEVIRSGILQKFIDPYGENQTLIQAIYSPQLCIFSKRVNYRHLYDNSYDPYERLLTFDGAEMYSRTVPLRGNSIRLQDEQLPANIPLKKMKNTPLNLDNNYIRPEEIKLIQTTNTMRPIQLENDIKCFHCQEKIQSKDLVPVTYEFIINNFEENPNAQYSKVSNVEVIEVPPVPNFVLKNKNSKFIKDQTSQIPALLAKLYPKLSLENYLKFRKNQKFLNQKFQQHIQQKRSNYVNIVIQILQDIQKLVEHL
ncbi:hypothetical protein IMG5_088100 [Ichthyophthirius multifiliis]|uniref:Uncharacterized protein n=1 Tax=Ichthyophthirius multifiliis TaxID=5932 RepID=G0QR37_ICHMU|nr:hypothetical protein IMG5_088100 [Ichthyophthirius multifiliis]EGR32322.1 hypothetical protein IMG5_088100 [Ichthyophthirius multifiliis]|eukprot:XP_004035808.1 hypothetical protein IMG5_088100 [Ichthyophthirius multifiliis]